MGVFGDLLARADSWATLISSIGDETRDKLTGAYFKPGKRPNRRYLERLYQHNGIAATIVDAPVFDATRKWVDLKSADMDMSPVAQALRDMPVGKRKRGVRRAVKRALTDARLHGGGAIIIGAADGREPHEPLDEDGLLSIEWLATLSAEEMVPLAYNDDPESPDYGAPSSWQIQADTAGVMGGSGWRYGSEVHASRVIAFDGVIVSERKRLAEPPLGWGDSVLIRCQRELRNVGLVEDGAVRTMLETNIPVIRTKGLASMVGSKDGETRVLARMRILAACKSILNILLLDAEESFEYKQASLAGYDKLLNIYPNRLAAVSGIPLTRLYGVSPGGLNATGESDLTNYYDRVMGEIIEPEVVPAVTELARLVMLSHLGPTGGKLPEQWEVVARPLRQLTEKEQAELEKIAAETDSKRIADGVLSREEIRESRFGGDGWSNAITLSSDTPPPMPGQADPRQDSSGALPHPPALLGLARVDAEDGDGQRVGLFFRLPPELASQRPPLPEDDSPAHVTFLFIGDVRGREDELLQVLGELAKEAPLSRGVVGEVDSLMSPSGRLIMYQRMRFLRPGGESAGYPHDLDRWRDRVVAALRERFFPIADVSPHRWLPHTTLAYLADHKAVWTGVGMVGSWFAGELEVWGLPGGPRVLELGPPPTDPQMEVLP